MNYAVDQTRCKRDTRDATQTQYKKHVVNAIQQTCCNRDTRDVLQSRYKRRNAIAIQ